LARFLIELHHYADVQAYGTLTLICMRFLGLTGCSALLTMFAVSVPPTAAGIFQDVSTTTSSDVETRLGKGYDALKNDRYDEAVSQFRAALQADSTLALRARFPLAVALFELRKYDEARHELETVRSAVGDHPNVLYYLGRADLEERNFADAVKYLQSAAANPPFPDTAYYLGYAYAKQDNLALAEKWLKKAAEAMPRDSRIPYQLGLLYRKQGRTAEADKAMALSSALRRNDDSDSKIRLQCAQKLEQGSRSDAYAVCNQLYDPDNSDKLTELGTLYGQHGDVQAALKPLQRAAELSPQSPQVQYNLAYAYYQLGRFEEARAPLARVIKQWPDLFQLNALYGAVLFQLGDDVKAYQALHKAKQLNPDDTATLELLFATTLRLSARSHDAKNYTESLRYLGEAASLRPNDAGPHRLMAEIYTEMARPDQAAAERAAAERLSSNPN